MRNQILIKKFYTMQEQKRNQNDKFKIRAL